MRDHGAAGRAWLKESPEASIVFVMIGYWDPDCPVKTDNKDVLATVYERKDRTLIALAAWAREKVDLRLDIDWKVLGLDPGTAVLHAPEIRGYRDAVVQPGRTFSPDESLSVEPRKGPLAVARPEPAR